MAARTLRRKNNNQSRVFFGRYFFMFTLTTTTEKELDQVIENWDEFRKKKNVEIQSGGQKMRNASP